MDIYHSPPFNTNFLVLVPTLALTLILILMLISIVTQQIEAPPPAIQPAHALLHCISDKQHDIHTYALRAALRCNARQRVALRAWNM